MTAEGSAESPVVMADARGTAAGGPAASSAVASAATAAGPPDEQLLAKLTELQGHIENDHVWDPGTAAARAAPAATVIAEAPPARARDRFDPAVEPTPAPTQAPAPVPHVETDGEADEWIELFDDTGRKYLANARTRKTKWADPPPSHRDAGCHHGMMNTAALRIAIPGDSATRGARGAVRNSTLLSEAELERVGGWLDLRGVPTNIMPQPKASCDREYEGVTYHSRENKSKSFSIKVYIPKELAYLRKSEKGQNRSLGETGRGCRRQLPHRSPPTSEATRLDQTILDSCLYQLTSPGFTRPHLTRPRHATPHHTTPHHTTLYYAQARTPTSCRRRHCTPWLSGRLLMTLR